MAKEPGVVGEAAQDVAREIAWILVRAALSLVAIGTTGFLWFQQMGLEPALVPGILGLIAAALYLAKRKPRDAVTAGIALLGAAAVFLLPVVGLTAAAGACVVAATLLALIVLNWELMTVFV